MRTRVHFLLGFPGLLLLVGIVWRFASRRRSLPCPVWLRWVVELDNPFTRINRAAVIIEHLDLQPDMAVLDVGCGPDRVAVPLAERVPNGEVVAVDIQEGMLKRAQEKARLANVTNIRFPGRVCSPLHFVHWFRECRFVGVLNHLDSTSAVWAMI